MKKPERHNQGTDSIIKLTVLTFLLVKSVVSYAADTIQYFQHENVILQATLYLPDSGINRPALVLVHEGGFTSGDRHCFIQYGPYYTKKGYAVFSIDYRLLQQGGTYPIALKDCIEALRWLKAHATQYSIDKEKIVLIGSSAGAYLATMMAISEGLPKDIKTGQGNYPNENNQVAGVVSSFGPYDWQRCGWKGGGFVSRDRLKTASPIQYIHFMKAGIMILAGDRDRLFPIKQAVMFADSLNALGKEVDLHIKPGQAHGGICEMQGEIAKWAIPIIDKFLARIFTTEEK
jgi:acetyl esterase/lipase